MRRLRRTVAGALVLAQGACGSGDATGGSGGRADAPAIATESWSVLKTVVTSASGVIGFPTALAIGPNGDLWVADHLSHDVVRIDPQGLNPPARVGREGAGPGEFEAPMAIAVSESQAIVLDRGNGRVQRVSLDGADRGAYPIGRVISGGVAVDADGRAALAGGALGDALLRVYDAAGDHRSIDPRPPVGGSVLLDALRDTKRRIMDGELPDRLRRELLPVLLADGGLWVAMQVEPELRRYDAELDQTLRVTYEEPAAEAALAAFFEANRDDPRPTLYRSPRSVADAKWHEGGLWLLMHAWGGRDAVLRVSDGEDGRPMRRIVVAGAGAATAFAVAPSGARIYLGLSDDASIVVATPRDGAEAS